MTTRLQGMVGVALVSVAFLGCGDDSGDDCVDADRDGYGELCTRGPDCDDGDAARHTQRTAYVDADHDGTARDVLPVSVCAGDALPVGFVEDPGDDCNDANPDTIRTCDTCGDADNDGSYAGCDTYTQTPGPDCNDRDRDVLWSVRFRENPSTCMRDADRDGFGDRVAPPGGVAGTDCDDDLFEANTTCATCMDADRDGAFAGCDRYADGGVEDCDDTDRDNQTACAQCVDQDGDEAFTGCDRYLTRSGPDCDDTDPSLSPREPEIADNGIDDSCLGADRSALGSVGVYVAAGSGACDDSGPGTRQVPFCTLAPAADISSDVVLFLARGTYVASNLEFEASTRVEVHGGYRETDWTRDPDTFVSTIELRGNAVEPMGGTGLYVYAQNVTIEGVRFSIAAPLNFDATLVVYGTQRLLLADVHFGGETRGPVFIGSGAELSLFRGVTMDVDVLPGAYAFTGGSASIQAARDLVVERSVFASTQPVDWSTFVATGAVGGRARVVNNTFSATVSGVRSTILSIHYDEVSVLNNSFYGEAVSDGEVTALDLDSSQGPPAVVANNAYYVGVGDAVFVRLTSEDDTFRSVRTSHNVVGAAAVAPAWLLREGASSTTTTATAANLNACSSCGTATLNVDADPMFTNAPNGDFTPAAGSPLIGGGVAPTSLDAGWLDTFEALNGVVRPVGAYDVGAYELSE
ncbi:MAG: hypothetical protein H6726_04505 [Sandaracinaceae bacterium]|nr:hypothetical protein [Sandaracinaceae bacterium]